jgi:hypothetical protein
MTAAPGTAAPGTAAASAADPRPGLAPRRLVRLMADAVAECGLDLSGRVVLTEAATGAYVVTPVLAALAGADRVLALTRPTRYGTVAEVAAATSRLAQQAGVADRITVTTERSAQLVGRADIVTNSGHLRPIDRQMVSWMRPTAVVPLMFEAWEAQAGRIDLDLAALRARGIAVAGTNERHPAVDVFSYLGLMAVKLLLDAGVAAYRCRIAVLCDNPFRDYLARGLAGAGAQVVVAASVAELDFPWVPEVVLVACRPRGEPVLSPADVGVLAQRCPGALVAQYWGDVDRGELAAAGLGCWPADPPSAGHMAVLPSHVGPEPVVRLQAGGLKVGQVLLTPADQRTAADLEFVDAL